MGAENLIWIHSDIIITHSLYPNFGRSLSEISDRDYPGRSYIKEDIEALDLDSYETSLPNSQNDCTVDAVVGICNERQGSPCNGRHLLVELRMAYRNVENLSASDIRQKDVHSRDLLMGCPDNTPIDRSLCLVFDPSVIFRAERWVNRIKLQYPYAEYWIAFSPSTFCNHVNAGKPIPYSPKSQTIQMADRFEATVPTNSIEILEEGYESVRNYLTDCRNRYEKGECKYLCQRISETLDRIKSWIFSEEDDKDLHNILIEDIERLIGSYNRW